MKTDSVVYHLTFVNVNYGAWNSGRMNFAECQIDLTLVFAAPEPLACAKIHALEGVQNVFGNMARHRWRRQADL